MPVESTVVKATKEAANMGTRVVETAVKKAWSIMDAASDKRSPSEILSKNAIQAIQG
jgi:hypothetical protein